jgi:hypothetical protein
VRRLFGALTLSLACASCAGMRPATLAAETAWQGLNIVDAGQTVAISRNPGAYEEGDAGTVCLIGRHPTARGVYVTMVGYAIAHAGVTAFLDEHDPGMGAWHLASVAWQAGTLGAKAAVVLDNRHLQIDPWMGTRHE